MRNLLTAALLATAATFASSALAASNQTTQTVTFKVQKINIAQFDAAGILFDFGINDWTPGNSVSATKTQPDKLYLLSNTGGIVNFQTTALPVGIQSLKLNLADPGNTVIDLSSTAVTTTLGIGKGAFAYGATWAASANLNGALEAGSSVTVTATLLGN